MKGTAMTDRIAEIEVRVKAATEGPWEYGKRPDGSVWLSTGNPERGQHYQGDWEGFDADAAFIAHARTDVPYLLAEVKRLREALAFYEREWTHDSCSDHRARATPADTLWSEPTEALLNDAGKTARTALETNNER
jgi:hypothetical protein